MLIKVANNSIYTGCLVPFLSSFEAEQYGKRIMEIGCKLETTLQFIQCACVVLLRMRIYHKLYRWSLVEASVYVKIY